MEGVPAKRPGPGGANTALGISANTQVKNSQGYVYRIFVITAPSAAGGVFDMSSGGTASTSNQLAVIPTTGGIVEVIAPCFNGIYIEPGTGGVVSVSYD